MIKGFKLESIIPNGVGGPEAGAIGLIYSVLLKKFKQDFYSLLINQIGNGTDPDELILKGPGNKLHINIRYPIPPDFEIFSVKERNHYQLDVIQAALKRIADYDLKYDKSILEEIRNEIIKHNFLFRFHLKKFTNSRNKDLVARLVVEPMIDMFCYYIIIEKKGLEIQKFLIYKGFTNLYYYPKFFHNAKWENENELIVTGREKVVETHILLNKNSVEFVNLTQYKKPPLFEMMKVDISKSEKEQAYNDWLHALPPSIARVIATTQS